MADEQVAIVLTARDLASGNINRVSGSLQRLGAAGRGTKSLNELGGILGRGIGRATANLERYAVRLAELGGGAGVVAVKWAVDFQKQMALIETQAGAGHDEVVRMTKAVQDLVASTATGPITLAEGLYHIESVGIRGAKALDILKTAALGARVGLADMESASNALTSVTYSGITAGKDMAQTMGILNAIVGVGNMRMQQLIDSFGTGILGTAKTFGVGLREVGSALAVLSDAGVPPQVAATRLQMTFTRMAAPTAAALKAFKAIGLGQFALAQDLRKPDGIFVALQDLHDHLVHVGDIVNGKLTPKGAAAVSKMFGGSRFGATAMQLLEQMDRVDIKYKAINTAQDKFSEAVKTTQATASYQFGQLVANLQEVGLQFGNNLLPGVAKFMAVMNGNIVGNKGGIAAMAEKVGQGFSGFIDKLLAVNWGAVADGFGAVASGVGAIIDAFMKAPDWVKGVLVGGFAINKLTGGMVTDLAGFGVKTGGNAILGILSTVLNRGGKAGLLGSALGAATASRVFVVNWPGGPLGGLGAAGVGGGVGGGLSAIGKAIGGAFLIVAAAGIADAIHSAISPDGGLQGRIDKGTTLPGDNLAWPWGPRDTPKVDFGPFKDILGGSNSQYDKTGGSLYPKFGPPAPNRSDTHNETRNIEIATAQANSAALRANTAALHDRAHKFEAKYSDLHKMLAGITKRSAAKYGGGGLGEAAVQATYNRDMRGHLATIMRSSQSAAMKLAQLKELSASIKQEGDTKTRALLNTDIGSLKTALERKKLAVKVNTTTQISIKDVINGSETYAGSVQHIHDTDYVI